MQERILIWVSTGAMLFQLFWCHVQVLPGHRMGIDHLIPIIVLLFAFVESGTTTYSSFWWVPFVSLCNACFLSVYLHEDNCRVRTPCGIGNVWTQSGTLCISLHLQVCECDVCISACGGVGVRVCAYSTCSETCTLQTLQYCLALQMSSHLVLEEALPELEYSLDLCFSNVSCKQKLRNPSQTQFSLTLSCNPNILLVASLLPHCAEQSLQRPVVAAPCHLQRGRKACQAIMEQLWNLCLSVPKSCGQGILQSSADRKAF